MEYRDIYTAALERTGKVVPKHGYSLARGEYYYHVHILLRDVGGLWLMQRRALDARHYPGQWDVTGGGVIAGEDDPHAAVREAREELGLDIDPAALRHAGRETSLWGEARGNITDIFACEVPIDLGALKLNPREVADARLVTLSEFIDTVMYNKTEYYRRTLERAARLGRGAIALDRRAGLCYHVQVN